MHKNLIKIAILNYLYTGYSVSSIRKTLKNELNNIDKINSAKNSQLLVDVSVIIQGDARTGIQRVVRAILSELLSNPPLGYEVRPIYANKNQSYCYAPLEFDLKNKYSSIELFKGEKVRVSQGDIFLALDLCTQQLSSNIKQLEDWKRNGVSIHVVVYDLFPVINPEWFNTRTTINFYRWLRTIAILADTAICISNDVKKELEKWLKSKYGISESRFPINVMTMGWDLTSTIPNYGIPKESELIYASISNVNTALMIGTIEPRKGHEKVLNAFEILWNQGYGYQLVIIGQAGWKTKNLQKRIKKHPLIEKKLFWLNQVSDEYLEGIIQNSFGLISASEGEGFGLPIVEVAKYKKPMLVRNLDVYREIKYPKTYFTKDEENQLANDIKNWFNYPTLNDLDAVQINQQMWKDTVIDIVKYMNVIKIH
jgi:glycosyltransferase involved in cell wall biosynthesis